MLMEQNGLQAYSLLVSYIHRQILGEYDGNQITTTGTIVKR